MSVYEELMNESIWDQPDPKTGTGFQRKRLPRQTPEQLAKLKKTQGSKKKPWPREGGFGDSTEYEGPSLSEQAEFIKTFLEQHKKPVPGAAEEKAIEKKRGTWKPSAYRPSSRRPSATDPGSTLGQ